MDISEAEQEQRQERQLDTEQILRLSQSVPSPKAEPMKIWLAQVGKERVHEIADPEYGLFRCTIARSFAKSKSHY